MSKKSSEQPTLYQPRMDWWVAALVLGVIALFSSGIPVIAASDLVAWQQGVVIAAVCGVVLYIIDIAFFSYYLLEEDGLVIASQFRHIFFSYRYITAIHPSGIKGLFSFRSRKRFALSTHCYIVSVRNAPWKTISISPHNRDGFIQHLLENIDNERTSRATVSHVKKEKGS